MEAWVNTQCTEFAKMTSLPKRNLIFFKFYFILFYLFIYFKFKNNN